MSPAMSRALARASYCALALALLALSPLAINKARAESFCTPGPEDRPETGIQGGLKVSERDIPGGFQGQWCGARKVGQHALYNRGAFGDLQIIVDDRGHCAYASMRDPSTITDPWVGTVVLDVSVASQPKDVAILRTPAMLRAYSAFEIPVSKATRRPGNLMGAAYKDFGPEPRDPRTNPLDLYDVSGNCLQPVHLSTFSLASGNHDGWFTPDGKTYYGVPFGGQTLLANPDRIDLHVTDISNPRAPQRLLNWNRRQLPPDVYERLKGTSNFHDISSNDDGTRLYMALYGGLNAIGGPNNAGSKCANGLLILDSSEVAQRKPNAQLHYISFLSWCDPAVPGQTYHYVDTDFGDGTTAATHATEYVIHENGKQYIVSTDESGAGLDGEWNVQCAQRTFGRLIDISDERNPRVVSTFKPDIGKRQYCPDPTDDVDPIRAIVREQINGGMIHYIGFDDRYNMRVVVYAGANYGMRFVDFRDPEHPKEIAYYKKENHVAANAAPAKLFANLSTGSTRTGENDFTRPDPRYDGENCLWYTGWNQGGLVTIELTNPEYNACMRRHASGGGWLAKGGPGKINLTFDAKRSDGGRGNVLEGGIELNDKVAGAKVRLDKLTFLGSMRDACGEVSARENAVQFEGTGTYNGEAASFRVCVRDNGKGSKKAGGGARNDDFYLTCTAGCSYSVGGKLGGGNIEVVQRP